MATQFLTPSTTPALTKVTAAEEPTSMMESFGFAAFGLYLFLMFSRMPELVAMKFGSSFAQILITSTVCTVMMIIGGGLARVIGSRMSIFIIGLHVWYFASLPFSYWKTGTVDALTVIMKVLPLVYFIMAFVRTEQQLRQCFAIMRVAMLISLLFTMTAPVTENDDQRLQLEGGRFSNSNEIAVYLLLGLPFWLHMATGLRFPMYLRVLAGFEIGLVIFQCLRTGSRGGLITILLLAAILFLLSSAVNKIKLVVLAAGVVVIAVPLLPQAVKGRLLSITGETRDSAAEGSSESRFALLMESIGVAARHPVFGVGVGVYADAAAAISAKAGKRKLWQVSHNSFAQVAAEAGLPALLLFIGTLVLSWRYLWRSRKHAKRFPEMQELGLMADCLLLTTFVFIVNANFGNMAQELFYYLVCGMAFSCSEIIDRRYDALVRAETENVRRAAEASTKVGSGLSHLGPESMRPAFAGGAGFAATPSPANTPEKQPVIGRPKPVAPESLYGDVPWARNPNRR